MSAASALYALFAHLTPQRRPVCFVCQCVSARARPRCVCACARVGVRVCACATHLPGSAAAGRLCLEAAPTVAARALAASLCFLRRLEPSSCEPWQQRYERSETNQIDDVHKRALRSRDAGARDPGAGGGRKAQRRSLAHMILTTRSLPPSQHRARHSAQAHEKGNRNQSAGGERVSGSPGKARRCAAYDGVYVCVWVARGAASSLRAAAKHAVHVRLSDGTQKLSHIAAAASGLGRTPSQGLHRRVERRRVSSADWLFRA